MKSMKILAVAILAALALLGAAAVPASATGYVEMSLDATIDEVLVNRTGGITMSGTLDCADVVTEAYGSAVPANTTVFASVDWSAYQYVGKNKVVYAEYASGMASICYTNDASMATYANVWRTTYPFPMGGTTQWVYSRDGKFTQGPVHIELRIAPVTFVYDDVEYAFYNLSGWDLKAVRLK